MLPALAFYLWSQLQQVPVEVAHSAYSAAQTAAAWYYGFHSREVTADHCTTRYLEKGHGSTLLLIHGAAASKEVWLPVIPYLAKHYHLIIPDLPGHGQSCRDMERDFSMQGYSRWLKAFLDRLSVGRVHIAGHSAGGSVAAWFTAEQTGHVGSLTLIAPAGIEDVPADYSSMTPFMLELVQTGRNRFRINRAGDFYEQVVKPNFYNPPWAPWGGYRFLAWEHMRNAEQLEKVTEGLLTTREDIQSGKKNLEQLASDIDAPMQVIWGEKDQITHIRGADVAENMRSDIKVYRLSDAGHALTIEAPQQLAEYVEKLVKESE
ncbi:alpha/beta fold hydrolase [Sansalvadorimonas verongulae]|uniref:alpha/beta fold hydrolase n=1 Tax=Sansalvadorimonas verongulae TaxID=2172824 RepID=UPI0012BC9E8E|nr:alpha/beta fold hydrolase [Sansalvadorimonas verongulae]MTI14066.1 alpha/beta fold hydrolase [Sansalvadorimonas verongulae]